MILPLLVDGALAGSVMIKKAPIIVAPPNRCIIGDPPLLELPLSKKIKDKKTIVASIANGLSQLIFLVMSRKIPPAKKAILIHSQPEIIKNAS